ncbi:O-methylsterigmatocystin oxidoreductase [Earliella scabrosa]|nr:O-methylsterigmatocystin oxidoreductase [Earliella scabrosa]
MAAEEYCKLVERYPGDVVYLNVLSQPMIILKSYRAASELLEKRATNYSDRPQFVMTELIGADWVWPYNGYTDLWRRRRKEFHQHFSPSSIAQYRSAQEEAAQKLLQLLLASPEAYADHVQFSFGSTILRIVYGVDISTPDNQLLVLEEHTMRMLDDAFTPGRFLVEVLPFLRYLPAWFPGGGFKTTVETYKATLDATRNKPFDMTLEHIGSGDAMPSVVSAMIENAMNKEGGKLSVQADSLSRDVSGVAYLAAVETLVSSMYTFFYAMALHPDVQRGAQAELDAVIGASRLPLSSDRAALPYVNALVSECLRWLPAVPLGLPHRSMEDDEYAGYSIPGKSVVFSNVWAFTRNAQDYPEADRFMPERFLTADGQPDANVLNPRAYVFGLGRRICPGMHFGEASLFITMASVLHVFTIGPPCDASGRPTIPSGANIKMKPGFITHPELLKYSFTPRSPALATLVRADASL